MIQALVSVAAAMVVWPSPPGVRRLAAVASPPTPRSVGRTTSRWRDRRLLAMVTVSMCVLGSLFGVLVVVSFVVLLAAVATFRRERRRARSTVDELDGLASALQGVAGELRAGSHPVRALESVAAESPAGVAQRLHALAVSTRMSGGAVEAVGARENGEATSYADLLLARAATAWSLTAHHGVPVADVVEALHRDADAKAHAARRLDAKLAGARAGAAILAVLPVAGVALGEAMGAAPMRVLTSTAVGSVVFLTGTALILGGVAWTSRLTRQVVP